MIIYFLFLILLSHYNHAFLLKDGVYKSIGKLYGSSTFKGPGAKVALRIKEQFRVTSDFEVRNIRRGLKKYRRQQEKSLSRARRNIVESERNIVNSPHSSRNRYKKKSAKKVLEDLQNPFVKYLLPKKIEKAPPGSERLGLSLDVAANVYGGMCLLDDRDVRRRPITSLEFIGSYYHTDDLPFWGLPEVCLIGRSNVGKSSFINTIMSYIKNKSKKCDLAYVSKTPGYTKSINIFKAVDRKDFGILSIVDLPGYGYAKIKDPDTRSNMQRILRAYIRRRRELKLVIFLIDGSVPPQDNDYQVSVSLREMEIPHLIICTMMDKVSINKVPSQILLFRQAFNIESPFPIPYSKYGGSDLANIWKAIFDACNDEFDIKKLNITDKFENIQSPDYSTFVEGQNAISLKDLRKIVFKNYHLLPESMKALDINRLERDQLLDLLQTAAERSEQIQNRPLDIIELKNTIKKNNKIDGNKQIFT